MALEASRSSAVLRYVPVWAISNFTLDPPTTTQRRIPLTPLRASLDVSVLREIQRITEQYWNWVHLSPQDFLDTYLACAIACFSPEPAAPATGARQLPFDQLS